mmetsp:Transcript_4482/g.9642  ORF Transcript_4482/g.9642 Transcript_4482/m.9642 type:complete len:250 (+) Transcript_4482:1074-1823(+)
MGAVRALPRLAVMHHVGDQVVLGAGRVRRQGQDVPQLQVLDREVDDGRVLLHEEVVLGEALHVQAQVSGQSRDLEAAAPRPDVIAHTHAVKLAHDVEDGDLRDDVLLQHVLEQGGGRQVQTQQQEGQPLHHVLGGTGRLALAGTRLSGHLQLTLEAVRDDGALLGPAPRQFQVQRVEEPGPEVNGVGSLLDDKALLAGNHDGLHELMGGYLPLEVARVPHLAQQLTKPLHQHGAAARVVVRDQEEVPDG